MSEQPSDDLPTEQITKPPVTETPVRIKDPRRVAAGKALAARNKAAREAKAQSVSETSNGGLSFNGVMQLAAVVGAGFTLYHGYQVVKPYLGKRNPTVPRESYERPVETVYEKPKQPRPVIPPKPPANNQVKSIDME